LSLKTRELLSFGAYARRRGVSVEAVSKAVRDGRISVLTDAKGHRQIDPETADREWEENSDPSKRIGGAAAAAVAKERFETTHPLGARYGETAPGEDEDDDLDDEDRERGGGGTTYNKARARREAAAASMAELKLAERMGELVEVAKVEKGAHAVGGIIREAMLGLPDRIAGLVASETDPAKVHAILSDEIRRALEELTRDV
jgi:phage terminase Nu1 subunit (DNA packaging protein)